MERFDVSIVSEVSIHRIERVFVLSSAGVSVFIVLTVVANKLTSRTDHLTPLHDVDLSGQVDSASV